MSYEIVKKIRIDDNNKVYITGASNNVYPRTPEEWHCSYYDNFPDRKSIDIDILKAYESGSFQAGTKNKYTKALKILRHMQEYKLFDWKASGDDYERNKKNRKTDDFVKLLEKALQSKLPKDKFIISKDYFGKRVFGKYRKNGRSMRWTPYKEKATIFSYREDAEDLKTCFYSSENWEIIKK